MLKFKQTLIAFFVVLALVSLVTLLTPSRTRGQGERPPSSVNVVNTPDVNVVNAPDVNVANTVRVSEPRREAVNVEDIFTGDNGSAAGILFTVPPGKQLVVTYASASAAVLAGLQVRTVVRAVDGGGGSFSHHLKPVAVNASNFVASEPVQFRVDAGTRVEASMNTNNFGSNPVTLRVTISGYLVDVPQQ